MEPTPSLSEILPLMPARYQQHVRETPTGCWEWSGPHASEGYGSWFTGGPGGRNIGAHRAIYQMVRGPIPDGMQLDHLCRRPACVNPDHLEPVTRATNLLRGVGPTAANAAKESCKHGHSLTDPDNVIIRIRNGRPNRRCATCRKVETDRATARAAARSRQARARSAP